MWSVIEIHDVVNENSSTPINHVYLEPIPFPSVHEFLQGDCLRPVNYTRVKIQRQSPVWSVDTAVDGAARLSILCSADWRSDILEGRQCQQTQC
jgi:hypothetical protein